MAAPSATSARSGRRRSGSSGLAPELAPADVTPRDADPTLAKKDPALARFGEEVVAPRVVHRGLGHASLRAVATAPRRARRTTDADPGDRLVRRVSRPASSSGGFPQARLTCIDTFAGMSEGVPEQAVHGDARPRGVFDANVALVDASGSPSSSATRSTASSSSRPTRAQFDLVYVDGSHLGLDVLVDAALSWNLLTPHGVARVRRLPVRRISATDPLLRPGPAIDAFRLLVAPKHEVLFADHQIALRRIS